MILTTEQMVRFFFNEDELHPVNRRRGIVYVAGSNFADSVYARYVHFGQYFDPNTMVFDQDTNVIQNFYLLYNKRCGWTS